ncbi:MAG: four helix bundle protein [Anaerolineales bacterium]|nr:four helix bundle protein [Anaerolineales bacterium]
MQDFRKLKVWEKSHQLTLEVYRVTLSFPNYELFGLANQLRRSVASIPANIAEGCGRSSGKELKQALNVARGSATETEYHLLLANQLNYISDRDYERLNAEVTEIKRMLTVLMSRITLKTDKSSSHSQIAEQPYEYLLSIETKTYSKFEQTE